MIKQTEINWEAYDNARRHYFGQISGKNYSEYEGGWPEWILKEGGIHNTTKFCFVVDEEQYLLFLLRFA